MPKRSGPARTRILVLALLLGLCALGLCALGLTRARWLPALGAALIQNDGPGKAEIIVVLGGDYYGHRVVYGAQLARDGWAPQALVDGPPAFYGLRECDLAIPFAVRAGYASGLMIPFPIAARSTREEATEVVAELRRRGMRSALVVTSDYHTARAGRLFRAEVKRTGGGIAIRMAAAPDEFFRAGSWWRTREARKTAFFEWLKTVTGAFGI